MKKLAEREKKLKNKIAELGLNAELDKAYSSIYYYEANYLTKFELIFKHITALEFDDLLILINRMCIRYNNTTTPAKELPQLLENLSQLIQKIEERQNIVSNQFSVDELLEHSQACDLCLNTLSQKDSRINSKVPNLESLLTNYKTQASNIIKEKITVFKEIKTISDFRKQAAAQLTSDSAISSFVDAMMGFTTNLSIDDLRQYSQDIIRELGEEVENCTKQSINLSQELKNEHSKLARLRRELMVLGSAIFEKLYQTQEKTTGFDLMYDIYTSIHKLSNTYSFYILGSSVLQFVEHHAENLDEVTILLSKFRKAKFLLELLKEKSLTDTLYPLMYTECGNKISAILQDLFSQVGKAIKGRKINSETLTTVIFPLLNEIAKDETEPANYTNSIIASFGLSIEEIREFKKSVSSDNLLVQNSFNDILMEANTLEREFETQKNIMIQVISQYLKTKRLTDLLPVYKLVEDIVSIVRKADALKMVLQLGEIPVEIQDFLVWMYNKAISDAVTLDPEAAFYLTSIQTMLFATILKVDVNVTDSSYAGTSIEKALVLLPLNFDAYIANALEQRVSLQFPLVIPRNRNITIQAVVENFGKKAINPYKELIEDKDNPSVNKRFQLEVQKEKLLEFLIYLDFVSVPPSVPLLPEEQQEYVSPKERQEYLVEYAFPTITKFLLELAKEQVTLEFVSDLTIALNTYLKAEDLIAYASYIKTYCKRNDENAIYLKIALAQVEYFKGWLTLVTDNPSPSKYNRHPSGQMGTVGYFVTRRGAEGHCHIPLSDEAKSDNLSKITVRDGVAQGAGKEKIAYYIELPDGQCKILDTQKYGINAIPGFDNDNPLASNPEAMQIAFEKIVQFFKDQGISEKLAKQLALSLQQNVLMIGNTFFPNLVDNSNKIYYGIESQPIRIKIINSNSVLIEQRVQVVRITKVYDEDGYLINETSAPISGYLQFDVRMSQDSQELIYGHDAEYRVIGDLAEEPGFSPKSEMYNNFVIWDETYFQSCKSLSDVDVARNILESGKKSSPNSSDDNYQTALEALKQCQPGRYIPVLLHLYILAPKENIFTQLISDEIRNRRVKLAAWSKNVLNQNEDDFKQALNLIENALDRFSLIVMPLSFKHELMELHKVIIAASSYLSNSELIKRVAAISLDAKQAIEYLEDKQYNMAVAIRDSDSEKVAEQEVELINQEIAVLPNIHADRLNALQGDSQQYQESKVIVLTLDQKPTVMNEELKLQQESEGRAIQTLEKEFAEKRVEAENIKSAREANLMTARASNPKRLAFKVSYLSSGQYNPMPTNEATRARIKAAEKQAYSSQKEAAKQQLVSIKKAAKKTVKEGRDVSETKVEASSINQRIQQLIICKDETEKETIITDIIKQETFKETDLIKLVDLAKDKRIILTEEHIKELIKKFPAHPIVRDRIINRPMVNVDLCKGFKSDFFKDVFQIFIDSLQYELDVSRLEQIYKNMKVLLEDHKKELNNTDKSSLSSGIAIEESLRRLIRATISKDKAVARGWLASIFDQKSFNKLNKTSIHQIVSLVDGGLIKPSAEQLAQLILVTDNPFDLVKLVSYSDLLQKLPTNRLNEITKYVIKICSNNLLDRQARALIVNKFLHVLAKAKYQNNILLFGLQRIIKGAKTQQSSNENDFLQKAYNVSKKEVENKLKTIKLALDNRFAGLVKEGYVQAQEINSTNVLLAYFFPQTPLVDNEKVQTILTELENSDDEIVQLLQYLINGKEPNDSDKNVVIKQFYDDYKAVAKQAFSKDYNLPYDFGFVNDDFLLFLLATRKAQPGFVSKVDQYFEDTLRKQFKLAVSKIDRQTPVALSQYVHDAQARAYLYEFMLQLAVDIANHQVNVVVRSAELYQQILTMSDETQQVVREFLNDFINVNFSSDESKKCQAHLNAMTEENFKVKVLPSAMNVTATKDDIGVSVDANRMEGAVEKQSVSAVSSSPNRVRRGSASIEHLKPGLTVNISESKRREDDDEVQQTPKGLTYQNILRRMSTVSKVVTDQITIQMALEDYSNFAPEIVTRLISAITLNDEESLNIGNLYTCVTRAVSEARKGKKLLLEDLVEFYTFIQVAASGNDAYAVLHRDLNQHGQVSPLTVKVHSDKVETKKLTTSRALVFSENSNLQDATVSKLITADKDNKENTSPTMPRLGGGESEN